MPEPLLTVSGLHTGYGATEILRGVDLAVQAGEIVALVGESGCGKSLTAVSILRLLRPKDAPPPHGRDKLRPRGDCPPRPAARPRR